MKLSLGSRETEFQFPIEFNATSGESYEMGEYINRGGNGVVCECINNNGDLLAVKFLLRINNKSKVRFQQEINLLKNLDHPHIIKYIDSGSLFLKNSYGRIDEILFVVMEKADYDLLKYLRNHGSISYEIYAPQFRGLSGALAEIHRLAVHRDIKPENILVKGETWLISDLGLCSYLSEDDYVEITGNTEKIGPKFWLSPEAINRQYFSSGEILECSDVFQLCAVFWFAVTFRHPTGILCSNDWIDQDEKVFDVLFRSLSHDNSKRPQNGNELFNQMSSATLL